MTGVRKKFGVHDTSTDNCSEVDPLIPSRFRVKPSVWKEDRISSLASSMKGDGYYKMDACRESKTWAVILVAFVLFLDYTLLTAIVPIMPQYLLNEEIAESASVMDENVVTEPATISLNSSVNNDNASLTDVHQNLQNSSQNVVRGNTSTSSVHVDTISWILSSYAGDTTDSGQFVQQSSDQLQDTTKIGLMLASKPFIQLATIPLIGLAMSKIPASTILLGGFLILFVSSLLFGIGSSFTILFFARSLQGIGSSCSNLAGMTLLAEMYPEQEERATAMGRALGGIALGTLFGPVYGGIMYELYGMSAPFLILAALSLAGAGLHVFVRWPTIKNQIIPFKSMKSVVLDPYILLVCVAITIPNMALTLLESALPSWMMSTMNATTWQQGVIFLPDCICYLICTYYIGSVGERFGRWRVSMTGFIMLGLSFVLIPLTHQVVETAFPMLILGVSLGLSDGTMIPELGNLADIRHAAVYGAVYALEEIVVCLGYMIGPVFGGVFINWYGFEKTCFCVAVVCFVYAPFLYFLKHPHITEETETIMNKLWS